MSDLLETLLDSQAPNVMEQLPTKQFEVKRLSEILGEKAVFTLRALPYLMIGIGCGLFGHGVGEMVNRRVLDSNPTLAKEQEIAQKDERNVALANRAKAKAYDLMTYMMAALLLTFALMGVAMEVVVVLVLAYLAIEF